MSPLQILAQTSPPNTKPQVRGHPRHQTPANPPNSGQTAALRDLRPDWINDAAKLKTVSVDGALEPIFEGADLVVEFKS